MNTVTGEEKLLESATLKSLHITDAENNRRASVRELIEVSINTTKRGCVSDRHAEKNWTDRNVQEVGDFSCFIKELRQRESFTIEFCRLWNQINCWFVVVLRRNSNNVYFTERMKTGVVVAESWDFYMKPWVETVLFWQTFNCNNANSSISKKPDLILSVVDTSAVTQTKKYVSEVKQIRNSYQNLG